jgi:hypothetical protein
VAQLKRTLKGLRRRGRLAAIDALVARAAARGADGRALLEAALPFASDAALRQQWPGLEEGASALTWGLLANYHPAFCSERLQQSDAGDREARLAAAFPWLVVHDQEGALQLLQSLQPAARLELENPSVLYRLGRAGRAAASKRNAPISGLERPPKRAKTRRLRIGAAAHPWEHRPPLSCAINRWGLAVGGRHDIPQRRQQECL